MIPIKICGITSYSDAQIVINYNPSAIGFIFYKNSVRYVDPHCIVSWVDKNFQTKLKMREVAVGKVGLNSAEGVVSSLPGEFL